jgi:hypothetical protein
MSKQDKMIKSVMKNFDWNRVQSIMEHLDWRWRGAPEVPSIAELKAEALECINGAIYQAIGNTESSKDIGWISACGGLKAIAYRTNKNKLAQIRLEFNIAEWESCRNDFNIKA